MRAPRTTTTRNGARSRSATTATPTAASRASTTIGAFRPAEGLGGHEGGEQRDGQGRGHPLHPRVLEVPGRDEVSGELEREGAGGADEHGRPQAHAAPRGRRSAMRAAPDARITGMPAGSAGIERHGDDRPDHRDRDGVAAAQPGPQQGGEGGDGGRVETVGAGVADRVAEERPGEGHEVPQPEDAQAGDPEAEAGARGSGCATATAVDSSIVSWAAATRRGPRTARSWVSSRA